jgi:hypothetical protein
MLFDRSMNAYDAIRLEDLRQRQQVQGETLTTEELARLSRLEIAERLEWENEPPPCWLGGDFPDVF